MIDFIDYKDPNITLIQKQTSISANIKTTSSIEIFGMVEGNIEAEGLASIYGKINGNIDARDFIAREESNIIGNIQLTYDGLISKNASVQGNVTCKNLEIYGSVQGNLKIEGSLIIRGNANILGDITCQSLVVDEGARINGNVKLLYQFYK